MKKIFLLSLILLLITSCKSDVIVDSYIYIDLPANGTTGYAWSYEIEDKDMIGLVSENYEVEDNTNNLVGVGGTEKYVFEIYESGETTIKLNYKRAWEDIPLYTIEYKINIDEYMTATLISKTGNYDEEIPNPIFKKVETPTDEYE